MQPQPLTTNKETPRLRVGPLTLPETRLHPPAASRCAGEWARQGRPDLSPRSRTRRFRGAPGPASNPFPPSHRRLGLTVPASSRFLRAHPRLERSAGPSSPAPPRAPPPRRTPRPNQTPCFCFEFRHPQGGGTRDSPRRDPSLLQRTVKKRVPSRITVRSWVWQAPQLDFALSSRSSSVSVPGRGVESGRGFCSVMVSEGQG